MPSPKTGAAAGLLPADTLVLCLSHLRWDFVHQRPQHLLSRAARDCDVIFFEEPVFPRGQKTAWLEQRVAPCGATIAVPHLPPQGSPPQATALRALLDAMLSGRPRESLVAWYYTPLALKFADHLAADALIYDCMDELSAFMGASPEIPVMEDSLFRRADLVFTGGRSLFLAKRQRHAHVHAFPSSVDVSHFLPARSSLADPGAQAALPRPRIGYFGVIDERLDLDLVDAMAARRPEWQFVMLGPVVKINPASLPRRGNIAWLGQQKYADLPAFLANWDVGLMPFALNDATRFISPTKTPEFLAAGLPVVSTPIADVVHGYGDHGLVEIASGALACIYAVERLLKQDRDDWRRSVDRHLAGMSWDRTWTGMAGLISATLAAKRPGRLDIAGGRGRSARAMAGMPAHA